MKNGSEHITLSGCPMNYGLNDLIYIESGAHHITLRNNFLLGNGQHTHFAVHLMPGVHHVSIEKNRIESFKLYGIFSDYVWPNTSVSGIYIANNLFRGFDENLGHGIYVEGDSIRIFNNRIYYVPSGILVRGTGPNIVSGNRIDSLVKSGIANYGANTNIENNYVTLSAGNGAGIYVQGVTNLKIAFNSLNNCSPDPDSKSLHIHVGNNLQVVNNILNSENGYCTVIEGIMPTNFTLDYNAYWSGLSHVGKLETSAYNSLGEWKTATGKEVHAVYANPYFPGTGNLIPNHILINNHGIPVPGIQYDIDSTLRNPATPDIGAKEFSICAPDAGIGQVTSPQNPLIPGLQEVKVILQNQGSVDLTSVTVRWSVNGQVQPPFAWVGLLSSGQQTELILGSYNFLSSQTYQVIAVTENPNGMTDCNNLNNQCKSPVFYPRMCGVFTIGGSNPDFSTIAQALTHLENGGISCPVTFLLRNGTYAESFLLGAIDGSSSVNTITFRSESGDSSKVYLNLQNALLLKLTSHIRMEKIHLEQFEINQSSDIIISNCWLSGFYRSIDVEYSDHIVLDRNYLSVQSPEYMALQIIWSEDIIVSNSNTANGISAGSLGYTSYHLLIENCIMKGISIYGFGEVDILNNQIMVTPISSNNRFQIGINASGSDYRIMNNRFLLNSSGASSTAISGTYSNSIISNNYISGYGIFDQTGIDLESPYNTSLYFNSINLKQDLQSTTAMKIKSGNQVNCKNNIFSVSGSGIPVVISSTNTSNLHLDYDDYFSNSGKIVLLNDTLYKNFRDWQNRLGGESHGFNVDPFFASTNSPVPNQVRLNNTGIPVTNILYDIDSIPRDQTNPDIGAKEFSPCVLDAGINAVSAPVSPLSGSSAEVRVILQNQGTTNLTVVKIACKINNAIQPPVVWTGMLESGDTAEVSLGIHTLNPGINRIRAWTFEPNNGADCNQVNDTCGQWNVYPELCGIYSVGGVNPDISKLADVAEILNNSAITCPVRFRLRNGTYPEHFALYRVEGSSPVNTITFESESGDSASVIITKPLAATPFPNTIALFGQSYVTLSRLTIESHNLASNSSGVRIEASHHDTIRNCRLTSLATNNIYLLYSSDIIIKSNNLKNYSSGIALDKIRNVAVSRNTIRNGNIGIRVGNHESIMGCNNLFITDNAISMVSEAIAIDVELKDTITILDNYIRNAVTGVRLKINAIYSPWFQIKRNKLLNISGKGIYIDTYHSGSYYQISLKGWVQNNFIHLSGNSVASGIYLNNVRKGDFSFNSFNSRSSNSLSRALYLSLCDSITTRDNIFSSTGPGYCCYFETKPNFLSMDYNNYYSDVNRIGCINGANYLSLISWKAAINGEANGKNFLPYFASDTSFHVYQRHLNGAAVPVPGITDDIEGDLRNPSAPDMGADEFRVDFGITELLNPTMLCQHTSNEHITVQIRQFGDIPFNTIPLAYSVNGSAPFYQTITGWVFRDTVFTFTPVINFATYGNYVIKCWMIGNYDDNISNDTLRVTRYSYPSPVPEFTWQSDCAGDMTAFFGTASVIPPYSISEYRWNFGDGGIDSVQNPIHVYGSAGTYQVLMQAFSNMGCYSEKTHTVQVRPGPVASFTVQSENCSDEPLFFNDSSTIASGSIVGWIYDFGDGVTDTIVPPESPDVYHSYDSSGIYLATLTVTAADGCQNVDTSLISIELSPVAGFAHSFPVCDLNPVNFTDTTDLKGGGPIVTWLWNFGDTASGANDTSTIQNPAHLFSAPGNFTVTLILSNSLCTDTVANSVTVSALPVPTVTGPLSVYLGDSGVVYATEPGMFNYQWIITGGIVTSGSGTNSVAIHWTSPGGQTVCVNYSNAAGCEGLSPACQAVEVFSIPAPAGIITGISEVCKNTFGVGYSVDTIPRATGYIWSLPSGATIASGNGTSSITVDFTASAVSGDITVQGTNAFGTGLISPFFPVIVHPLPVPEISGASSVCEGSSEIPYTTNSGMTGYTWAVSSGGSITSGAGTNIIATEWNSSSSQWVSVNYTDAHGCTAPEPTVFNVMVLPLPDSAGIISGNDTVCRGDQDVAYSVPAIANADRYIWSLPPGATIAGGGFTSEILVNYGATATSGAITVHAANDCGDGVVSPELYILVETCTGIGELPGQTMTLYPNPTKDNLILGLSGDAISDPVIVKVYSILGVEILKIKFTSGIIHVFSIEDQPNGIYIVRVFRNGDARFWKIIKQ
jgi:PKD repeat protein